MRPVANREAFDFNVFAIILVAFLPRPEPTVQCEPPMCGKVTRKLVGDDNHRTGAVRYHVFPGLSDDRDPPNACCHVNLSPPLLEQFLERPTPIWNAIVSSDVLIPFSCAFLGTRRVQFVALRPALVTSCAVLPIY